VHETLKDATFANEKVQSPIKIKGKVIWLFAVGYDVGYEFLPKKKELRKTS